MKIREIIGALEQFAPLSLQDSYDNAGLQIGLTEDADASGALLCLDVTEDVIDEAVSRACNLIVSHHPLLFRPPRHITRDDYQGRCILRAIRSGVALYAAHTNLDNAPQGVSHRMAAQLGLTNVRTLDPLGHNGTGGTAALQSGAGVVGELQERCAADEFVERLRTTFGVSCVRHNAYQGHIRRVALCGGAGAFLIDKAARQGADAYVTGEIGYHHFFGYEHDLLLAEIGHYESERHTLSLLRDIIAKAAPQLPIHDTAVRTNPVHYN